ncbi:unnamed protein product [Clonostachys rosea f. rosea IK726]|uniref:Zn(2)-C6 fungal-type domain-containing protein n=2 Tax=Bionectria ochroleuca TaxID=29856 RepID=A0A0B7KNS2_BIOOC|nr:unnamed protein product [Clonostachys rosea f. rosea IK726]
MEGTRSRRTSHACVPCRRKKVKCPGEQPVCSFCRRLGQACEYKPASYDFSQEAESPNISSRMNSLETKLDQVLNSLSTFQPNHSSGAVVLSSASLLEQHLRNNPEQPVQAPNEHSTIPLLQPGAEVVGTDLELAGELYLQWCHDQPISLFRKDKVLSTLGSRDQEIQLAISALAARFPPGDFKAEKRQGVASAVRSCRKLVTDRITNGKVRLSTLQCLCILSMVGFADGDSTQAGLDLTTATYLKDALPLGSSLGDLEEYQLCVHSISTLKHLQGRIPDLDKSVPGGTFLQLSNKPPDYEKARAAQDVSANEEFYQGILHYKAQAAEIWHMVRAYAAARVGADSLPPWSPQSDYSLVMLRNLEFECRFPLKYRYATSNFGGMSSEALNLRRDYWSSFFMTHFIHETTYILLNHPFLLSLRLRNFRHMLPLTFIHNSFEHLSRETGWVIFFLNVLEKQKFQLNDPVIAHCVVIVATVHLQHSFVEDNVLRSKAQSGYETCLRFLKQASSVWPRIMRMTEKLQQLRDSVAIDAIVGTEQPVNTHQSWSINANLLWELLMYEKAGSLDPEISMFDDTITLEDRQQQDIAECATVGSAGLFGHKAARNEHFAYPPQEGNNVLHSAPTTTGGIDGAGFLTEQPFTGLGELNMVDQQDYFPLQAEDFGKAINDWISFDMPDIS